MASTTHPDELARRWENLTIANDFVFCKAMLDEELCREVLETVLGMPVARVKHVTRQHVLDSAPSGKSVRLDVYVRDSADTVYDVEMQVADNGLLPRRARFYHAQMAVEQLDRGQLYDRLPNAFGILICNFDPFGAGDRVYSLENRCERHDRLTLADDAMRAASNPAEREKLYAELGIR